MSDERKVEPKIGETALEVPPLSPRRRFDNVRETRKVVETPRVRNWKPLKWLLWLLLLVLVAGLIYQELRTSYVQARVFHWLATQLTFEVAAGPAPEEAQPTFPAAGPFDQRAGYSHLAEWLPRLSNSGFTINEQSRFSPALQRYADWGFYPPYAENQAQFSLPDQAYLARSHPLELWLLAYLQQQPNPSLSEAINLSADARQQAYQWLFRTQSRSARDNRIRTMLEIEAFWDIHQRWQRLGYPFDYLVPSLATALGSSGDRPAALAELLGIIQNGGRRLPMFRVEGLHFAENTPYATRLSRTEVSAERVMAPEVAQILRENLAGVVQQGTGRRLLAHYSLPQLPDLAIMGGKTGTGDNRISTVNSRGETVQSRALNRTATFAFYFSDKYFGVISVYLPGNAAADYFFTSALPLQVLNGMAPLLMPLLRQQDNCPD
ncbi:hypothetical protein [Alishewanella longhuensis]